MIKKLLFALASLAFALGASLPSLAQSTAAQVLPGYLSTSGCPSGSTVCFNSFSDVSVTGSITTQNLVPAGVATTGSAVEIFTNSIGTVTIQVTGTYTGALSPQVTTDGTTWITQGSAVLQNMATGVYSTTIPSASTGIWQIEVNGHKKFRITGLAAVTGTAVITLNGSSGTSQVSFPSPSVSINQTTPGTTNGVVTNTGSVTNMSPAARTLVTLDVKTVTTGGTAVTALTAGHRTAGGFLLNPVGATINLCINEIGTATGTTSSGDTTCILPGQSYTVSPSAAAVSVITSDSSHPFSGYGLN